MFGEANKKKYISQSVDVSGNAGDTFNFTMWAKGKSLKERRGKYSRIDVLVTYKDGTDEWIKCPINAYSEKAWQFTSYMFTVTKDYQSLAFYLESYYNANDLVYGNISLFKDEGGNAYTYDRDGNLITTKDQNKQKSEMQYTGNSQLLKEISPKGSEFVYEYDGVIKNRLIKATNYSGQTYNLEYDDYGNTTGVKIEEKDRLEEVITGKTYRIKAISSKKYLDIYNGKVAQKSFRTTNYPKWIFEEVEAGYYRIRSVEEITKYFTWNESNNEIILDTNKNDDKQIWKISKNGDGTYTVINKSDETKCISIENDKLDENVIMRLFVNEGKETQKFILEEEKFTNAKIDNGREYYIQNVNSKQYITVDAAKTANKTEIHQWRNASV
ncbi:MAG: RICIN domain-containing protein, partial [Clostridia bacterium]|nr:RICIN domain-containing protein [Clostridia bacterium]